MADLAQRNAQLVLLRQSFHQAALSGRVPQHAGQHRCVGGAGRHDVAAHAKGRQFQRHRLTHGRHGRLGRAIGQHADARHHRRIRRDVDDGAPALRLEYRCPLLDEMKGARHVHVQTGIPVLGRQRVQSADAQHACGVHQHVQRLPARLQLRAHLHDGFRVRHVQLDLLEGGRIACAVARGRRGLPVQSDDFGTRLHEALCDALTDALCRAGNENPFTHEPVVVRKSVLFLNVAHG